MKEDVHGKISFTLEKVYTQQFERYYLSAQIERIRVFGKEKEILLQCDRPAYKLTNKRRAVKWKIISSLNQAMYNSTSFIDTLCLNLEYELDKIDFPRQAWVHPKNY